MKDMEPVLIFNSPFVNWFLAIFYNLNARILEDSSVNKRDADVWTNQSREDYGAKTRKECSIVYVG